MAGKKKVYGPKNKKSGRDPHAPKTLLSHGVPYGKTPKKKSKKKRK